MAVGDRSGEYRRVAVRFGVAVEVWFGSVRNVFGG